MRTLQTLLLALSAVSVAFAASTGPQVVKRDSAVALDNCNGSINSCFINGESIRTLLTQRLLPASGAWSRALSLRFNSGIIVLLTL